MQKFTLYSLLIDPYHYRKPLNFQALLKKILNTCRCEIELPVFSFLPFIFL